MDGVSSCVKTETTPTLLAAVSPWEEERGLGLAPSLAPPSPSGGAVGTESPSIRTLSHVCDPVSSASLGQSLGT